MKLPRFFVASLMLASMLCFSTTVLCQSSQVKQGDGNASTVGFADVNGDGKADLVVQYDLNGLRRWQARLSNGTSFDQTFKGDWTFTNTPNVTVVGLADVNGDGKADLILQYDWDGLRRWQARLSNGASFDFNGDWTFTNTPNVTVIGLADVNGDGKADLVLQYDWYGLRRWQTRLSDGSSFVWNGDWTFTNTPNVTAVGLADVNGDGKADLILQYDWYGIRRWQARLSDGSSFVWNGDWTWTKTPNVTVVGLADLNGDGKADLVLQYDWDGKRRWQGLLSNGSLEFVWNGDWTWTRTPNVTAVGLADLDGDGKADLVLQYDYPREGVIARRWQGLLSNGSSEFVWNGDWTWTKTPNVTAVGLADLNGDGKADLLLQYDYPREGVIARRWQGLLSNGSSEFVWNGDWLVFGLPGAIDLVHVPPYGTSELVKGQVYSVNPDEMKVVVYIKVHSGWWIKPYFAQPLTTIQADGSWSARIFTGGDDGFSTDVACFLVYKGYDPPLLAGARAFPPELGNNSLDSKIVARAP